MPRPEDMRPVPGHRSPLRSICGFAFHTSSHPASQRFKEPARQASARCASASDPCALFGGMAVGLRYKPGNHALFIEAQSTRPRTGTCLPACCREPSPAICPANGVPTQPVCHCLRFDRQSDISFPHAVLLDPMQHEYLAIAAACRIDKPHSHCGQSEQ